MVAAMSSRISLSLLAFLAGAVTVLALVSTGVVAPPAFDGLHPVIQVALGVLAALPVFGWFAIFVRMPMRRGGTSDLY